MSIEYRKRLAASTDRPTPKRIRLDVMSDFPTTHSTPGTNYKFEGLTNDVFTVGWICALEIELATSAAMLDEEFPKLPQMHGDTNNYTLGRIGEHNVVLACLPAGTIGTNAAATTATNMIRSFPNICFGLMVGIGGGAPNLPSDDPRDDIRLGDVVVSCPTVDSGGVLQYDFGKTMTKGRFFQTGTLNKTSAALRTGISTLRARHRNKESQVALFIDNMLQSNSKMREHFDHPGVEHDQLFRADYEHIEVESSCDACDRGALHIRKSRTNKDPVIHYGLIGSANRVMKHGTTREKLRQEKGILCFEMESAGLMDSFPCLVIRGICDYADSHKNKRWQPYASAAAAAYAKELLCVIPPAEAASASSRTATIYRRLQSVIDGSSPEQLLQLLPAIQQDQHTSAIPNLDPEGSKFSWVFRNIDYRSWRSNDGTSILCLSSSLAHHLSQVSSYIVSQEKKASHPVLYFFFSHTTYDEYRKIQHVDGINDTLGNALIYTLLKQILDFSPIEERVLVMRNFLSSLVKKTFNKAMIQVWRDLGFDLENISKALQDLLGRVAMEDLLAEFQMSLGYSKLESLLVVLDGIEKAYQGGRLLHLIERLINHLRRRTPEVRVLLAGPAPCDIKSFSSESLCIEHDKERKDCLASLRFDNTRYEKISPEFSGSFEWIWEHNEYKTWATSDNSRLLYIQGKPGSGKSTLTKYFGSNFQAWEPVTQQAIVARFFYSVREGELQRSHYNMLLTLLHDILNQDEAFFYHRCQTEYRAHRRSGVRWDYACLKRLLRSLQDYLTTNRFYLIIDAVDESDEIDRRDILNLFYELCSKMSHCVVKIFIASRPVAQLEARRDQFLDFIRLQDETASDISNFTQSLLDGLDFHHHLTQAIEYILDNAQGVFLWVKLIGEELIRLHEDGYSEQDIFDLLKQLPTELEELYALMLDKMRRNKPCLTYGLKMLRFILFARRPLTVDELLHSLGIPDSLEPDLNLNLSEETFLKRIPSERFIISCGGNFIEVKERDGERIVQVIHQTVREFFLDTQGIPANTEFRIDTMRAHICIAITCIRYLKTCTTNTWSTEKLSGNQLWYSEHYNHYAQYLNKRPLACYALCHLKYHIDGCGDFVNGNVGLQHLAIELNADWIKYPIDFLLESWAGSQLDRTLLRNRRAKILLTAAVSGLTVAVQALISARVDIDVEDTSGCTPLLLAVRNSQEAVARLLVMNGATVETGDKSDRTPLSWATEHGHLALVKMLLQKGAAVDTEDKSGRTPLSRAAEKGHEALVKLLLTNGATIDLADSAGRTPLSWAAENGHEAVMKQLLANGANIKTEDRSERTVLSWAAANGHTSVVKMLLKKDAFVDLQYRDIPSPFDWAAWNGHSTVMKLLVCKSSNCARCHKLRKSSGNAQRIGNDPTDICQCGDLPWVISNDRSAIASRIQ
ncbi:Kinesin [Trichoderma simmonsii]|uniref:Kinesin n=1 Tax=Trichoderma simmonsii TaxID=1491479 RepID=A0A8G0L6D4_9HYPO|nr:Kinesin [Trichoderma simmonsii]